jgi:hypothetical protein
MIVRNARLSIVTKDFDGARSKIEAASRQFVGYLDHLSIRGEARSGRVLSATLRLPSEQFNAGLNELRRIGTVQEESQNSSDVSSQVVDLRARLSNARNTEQRLLNVLRERTGKLEDIVNAEREVSRVREEIERMVAQENDITNRVQFAAIQVELSEEYRAQIEPSIPSPGTRLQNAMIEGYRGAVAAALGIVLFALRYGPVFLLWLALIVPLVFLLRRLYTKRIAI